MSQNLASILVGLGYDLSGLEKGAPEAFRLINQQTLGMSSEMKRASKEGAESLRLIDEALGIHLSRPLTRLLTQEFPSLAKGLQSVLGVGAAGAIGVAAFEFFDKVAKSIEKAQHAEEEYAKAGEKSKTVFSDIMAGYEKAATLRSLTGLDKKLFEIDSSAVEETRKKVDELAGALEAEGKAAIEAKKWTTELLAGIGDTLHQGFSTQGTLGAEAIEKQFGEIRKRVDELSRIDGLNQTHYAAAAIATELEKARATLLDMQSKAGQFKVVPSVGLGAAPEAIPAITPQELEAQKQFLENLQKIRAVIDAGGKDQGGRERDARAAEAAAALQREISAIQADDAATEHFAQTLVKLHASAVPAKDMFAEFDAEVLKQTISFTRLNALIGEKDFYLKFHQSLQQVLADLRAFDAAKLTPPEIKIPLPAGAGPALPSGTPVLPKLGSGGTAAAQLSVFSNDQTAQLKAAAQAYQDLLTPEDRYKIALGELNILLKEGLIDHAAYTAAVQKAADEMASAEIKIVHAKDGLRSFFQEMQQSTNTGKFTFEILNQGVKGFEDQVTAAIFTGKAKWEDYFRSLSESAFKFLLNKEIAQGMQALAGTGIGKSLGLGSATGGITGAAGDAAKTATTSANTAAEAANTSAKIAETAAVVSGTTVRGVNTTGETAATAALLKGTTTVVANTLAGKDNTLAVGLGTLAMRDLTSAAAAAAAALTSMGGTAGAGGSGIVGAVLGGGGVPALYASGTDWAPGGSAIVGEQGPELVNLPTGSSVTPNSSLRSTGHIVNINIDAKGGEIGVEAKIARMLQDSAPRMILQAITESSEIHKRSVGG